MNIRRIICKSLQLLQINVIKIFKHRKIYINCKMQAAVKFSQMYCQDKNEG